LGQQLYRFGQTTTMVALVVLIAYVVRLYWNPSQWITAVRLNPFWSNPQTGFALAILVISSGALIVVSYCRPWQYGWIRPLGNQWWLILPLALLAGLTGGVWAPSGLIKEQGWTYTLILWGMGMPLAVEFLFRSLAHGLLTQGARIQRYDSRWFFSWPLLGSAILYSAFVTVLTATAETGPLQEEASWRLALVLFAATVFGVTLGMVRERSQSLFPAIVFHVIAAVATIAFIRLM
jgi:hypothetical protein